MTFLIICRGVLFTEQYHLGKPRDLRAAMCIGKHVPVIEYSEDAPAVSFLKAYFENVWGRSEDRTGVAVRLALDEEFAGVG